MSGWLDRNRNRNPKLKEGKKEMCWIKFVFESYFEMDDYVWGENGCISEDCASFVSDNIFLRGWQAGAKMSSYVES